MKWAGAAIAICTVMLMALGLLVLASIGDVQAARHYNNPNHFLYQQAAFDALAFAVAFAAICIRPSFWFRKGIVALLAALVLAGLLATHVPGLRYSALGATRWIRIGGFLLQPSEFIKVAAVLLMSWWLGFTGRDGIRKFRTGFLPAVLGLGAILAGFFFQDDLGSCFMLAGVNAALLLLGGARLRHLLALLAIGAAVAGVWIAHSPVRRARFAPMMEKLGLRNEEEPALDQTPLSPEEREIAEREAKMKKLAEKNRTYQVRMAESAFAAGGLRGRGLGGSLYKRHYLPENHTDFILAMVGEELGLGATLGCLLLFGVILACGLGVSRHAPIGAPSYAAAGFALHICLSAAVNVGVVTGLLPTKGLALPFLSYGGSSALSSAAATGLLLAIAFRPGRPPPPRPKFHRATTPPTEPFFP